MPHVSVTVNVAVGGVVHAGKDVPHEKFTATLQAELLVVEEPVKVQEQEAIELELDDVETKATPWEVAGVGHGDDPLLH